MAKPVTLPRRVPESVVQSDIVKLLRTIGATVYVLGTRRGRTEQDHGTHQTPGVPDLIAFMPASGSLLFIEVKAQGGRLRPEQKVFRDRSLSAGIAHVVGDLDAVIAWLEFHGYLNAPRAAGVKGSKAGR